MSRVFSSEAAQLCAERIAGCLLHRLLAGVLLTMETQSRCAACGKRLVASPNVGTD
jgi:hypothetical protein